MAMRTHLHGEAPWSLVQRTIMDWINHAEEAGLSEDDLEMLSAVHNQDWNYIHAHVGNQQ